MIVPFGEWRRGAHKFADMVYSRLTGEGRYFDSRVVYVSASGPKGRRVKRLAMMDYDGAERVDADRRIGAGAHPAAGAEREEQGCSTPAATRTGCAQGHADGQRTGKQRRRVDRRHRWDDLRAALLAGRQARRLLDDGGRQHRHLPRGDGRRAAQRLTSTPGIDTGGSFSPDGNRIVFESDRAGSQQLYVMDADGSNQRRISFGGGRDATPEWSPRGDLIAYTQVGRRFPDRRDAARWFGFAGAVDQCLAGRGAELGAQWPRHPFLPETHARRGTALALFGRCDRAGWKGGCPTPVGASDPSWGPIRALTIDFRQDGVNRQWPR